MKRDFNLTKLIVLAVVAIALTGTLSAKTFGFEGLANGMQIDDADSSFSAYNTDGSSLLAVISTAKANTGSTSLKLMDHSTSNKPFVTREFAGGAARSGSVRIYCYVDSGNEKSTYINVGTGKNNDDRYFEIKISGSGVVQYENGSDDPKIGNVTPGAWHYYDLSWANGKFSVSVDGASIATNKNVLNSGNIPSGICLYTGDKSNATNTAYFDDISSDLF